MRLAGKNQLSSTVVPGQGHVRRGGGLSNLKVEIATHPESITFLANMTKNWVPDKLQSSREGGGDPENPLEQVVEVQKALDRL